jgi:hypothetical protein
LLIENNTMTGGEGTSQINWPGYGFIECGNGTHAVAGYFTAVKISENGLLDYAIAGTQSLAVPQNPPGLYYDDNTFGGAIGVETAGNDFHWLCPSTSPMCSGSESFQVTGPSTTELYLNSTAQGCLGIFNSQYDVPELDFGLGAPGAGCSNLTQLPVTINKFGLIAPIGQTVPMPGTFTYIQGQSMSVGAATLLCTSSTAISWIMVTDSTAISVEGQPCAGGSNHTAAALCFGSGTLKCF